MVEVSKKNNESFESLMRRFTRRTLQSGKLLQAKKIRFHRRPDSDLKKRERALRRIEIGQERDYLKRIGRLDETQDTRRRRSF